MKTCSHPKLSVPRKKYITQVHKFIGKATLKVAIPENSCGKIGGQEYKVKADRAAVCSLLFRLSFSRIKRGEQ